MAKGKYQKWLTHEGLVKLGGWARDGLTDEQIAKNMGIRRSTLSAWKVKYPDISDTLNKEKEVADYEVENALFNRARGMSIVEKSFSLVDLPGEVVDLKRRRYINRYKLDHPEASKQEWTDAAIEAVPSQKKVQTAEYHKQLPPDVGAIQFWLRNRQPLKYRDQSFAELNQAQAAKAKQDARKSKAEADIAEAKAKQWLENGDTVEDAISRYLDLLGGAIDGTKPAVHPETDSGAADSDKS